MWPRDRGRSFAEIFGRNIRACRTAKGLTLEQLAEEELGYPKELLDDLEHGFSHQSNIDFMVELSKFFNVPLDTLCNDDYFTPPEELYNTENAEATE